MRKIVQKTHFEQKSKVFFARIEKIVYFCTNFS